jgi:hypothetical protein
MTKPFAELSTFDPDFRRIYLHEADAWFLVLTSPIQSNILPKLDTRLAHWLLVPTSLIWPPLTCFHRPAMSPNRRGKALNDVLDNATPVLEFTEAVLRLVPVPGLSLVAKGLSTILDRVKASWIDSFLVRCLPLT